MSDSSLDSRSQGLINRGSSLISSSSTTASSLPANNYFNSKREPNLKLKEDKAPTERLPGHVNNDGLPSPVTSRCGRGRVNPEEDILYQWRLSRRLEEARREVKFVSEQGSRQFQPPPSHTVTSLAPPQHNRNMACDMIHSDDQPTKDVHTVTTGIASWHGNALASANTNGLNYGTTLDGGLMTGVPGLGTGSARNRMGTGTGLDSGIVEPILHPYPLAQAAVTKHEDREKNIGTLTDLCGVCSDKHGGLKSPNSSPRVNKKDGVVQTDPTFSAKEEETICKESMSTNTENLSPLSEQGEGMGATKNHSTSPLLSKQPEAWSSSSNREKELEISVNQSMISETTLTSVTQLDQPTTAVQAHTPIVQEDKCHGSDRLDLEQGVGVEESSYWTITPYGSPDSGRTHSLGPLINEV